MSWITQDNIIISSLEDMPQDTFGFVYMIKNIDNGKIYIGKKQAVSVTKKKFGKKKLAEMTDKRLKKYDVIIKESNWKDYVGSNKELLEDIKSGNIVIKTVLEFAFSKYHLTYLEAKYQFIHGVLETDKSYNDNILGRFYRSIFNFNKEQL